MDTKQILEALDVMEAWERDNPNFDLATHRKIREGLANYERDRKRQALWAKWGVIVTFLLWLVLWVLI